MNQGRPGHTHPAISMASIKSKSVKSVGYDADQRTLAVEFASGGLYHYHNVPPEVHTALLGSDSVGKFLAARVVGKYRHVKQDAKKEAKA